VLVFLCVAIPAFLGRFNYLFMDQVVSIALSNIATLLLTAVMLLWDVQHILLVPLFLGELVRY
jgi:hypothetical protein